MKKIKMVTPIVEMDGDEMTRILWKMIKDELILPFVDLKTVYYDLSLVNRDKTDDKVTTEAALKAKELGVSVKCATITPNKQRVEEYNLKQMWKSPNATIRATLDGTVFRAPILIGSIKPNVKTWKKPITIARHAYGDIYKATEFRPTEKGVAKLSFKGENGQCFEDVIYDFECGGVLSAQYNKDTSIRSFARSCFNYAVETGQDLWFSAKDTISKTYDQTFKLTFEEIYENDYRELFEKEGISYMYTLIDDAVARVIRSEGGFIWALKNYDGDVMSDMVSTAFGSLAMMTSVLVSPDGKFEYEAAHGTVTKHYYRYLKGEQTSTNPIATIFAWTGALRKRGELDGTADLVAFADDLEAASKETIESGKMTKDIALLSTAENINVLNSAEFIAAIQENLLKKYSAK